MVVAMSDVQHRAYQLIRGEVEGQRRRISRQTLMRLQRRGLILVNAEAGTVELSPEAHVGSETQRVAARAARLARDLERAGVGSGEIRGLQLALCCILGFGRHDLRRAEMYIERAVAAPGAPDAGNRP